MKKTLTAALLVASAITGGHVANDHHAPGTAVTTTGGDGTSVNPCGGGDCPGSRGF